MKKAAKRKIVFIVALLLLIFCNRLMAQDSMGMRARNLFPAPDLKADPFIRTEPANVFLVNSKMSSPAISYSRSWSHMETLLPGDFYNRQLGLMCRMEWALEKNTRIPLRFRLGSLEYCNWLEGKK
jgi:hypothetical protein